jgi:uncharacterized protein YjbI with pentapeptide repeats
MNTLTRENILRIIKTAQAKGRRPDFSGVDLSQTDLGGAYLIGTYFIGANLSQANLTGANLIEANLTEANLTEAELGGANLSGAYLSKANLIGANLIKANLLRAYLIGVDFSQTDLSGANLSEANLSQADLKGACLSGVNLSQADLNWADLSGANLSGANLSGANLSEANLSQANLSQADLSGTDLFRANFSGANLSGANLSWADLSQADLKAANLSRANITRAKFTEANFSRAVIGLTSFGDVNLNVAKGLDMVEHCGPSTIGIDTFSCSRGQISELFLRGCGLSDVQIETAKLNNPDLTSVQITTITYKIHELLAQQPAPACFIIYAGEDEMFAQKLHDDLQQNGTRCWLTLKDAKISDDKIGSTIDYSIRLKDRLLFILSAASVNSSWIAKEVEITLKEEDRRGEKVLFPLQLDDTMIKTGQAWATHIRYSRPVGDFTRWHERDAYQQSFSRLLQDLKSENHQP